MLLSNHSILLHVKIEQAKERFWMQGGWRLPLSGKDVEKAVVLKEIRQLEVRFD